MEKIDILAIHHNIMKMFEEKENLLPKLKSYVKNIEKLDDLSYRIKNVVIKEIFTLKELIVDVENKISKNYYLLDALPIICEYKKILQAPVKLNFMGKIQNKINDKSKILIKKYLEISQKYKKEHIKYQKKILVCKKCKNFENFTIENNQYICSDCGLQQYEMQNLFSYNAINRVNIASKYTYDRKVHFRDCVNQFQGKQNTVIPQEIIDYLINKIKSHYFVEQDAELPFPNITKEQIFLFLKDGKYNKYYDDITLIHYKITGIKPPDISHIASKLISNFDILTNLYDIRFRKNKKFARKNFINTQYVLYQLLRKYNFPCKSSDFNILKTVERKTFHDDICRQLFNELKWNFKAIF